MPEPAAPFDPTYCTSTRAAACFLSPVEVGEERGPTPDNAPPKALSDLRYRLRALFARASLEHELDDELRFHVEHATAAYERQGMSHDAALRRARIEFGGIEQMKEASRDMRGTARLESIARDLRYALRSLETRPAFTLTVVATLALGIGANTAIFTLVDALLLRPLPVSHPEQLAIVGDPAAVNTNNVGSPLTDYVSFPLYEDVRERNMVFSDMYATGWRSAASCA
ncbi:MAG: permease prefix domain 1-containing protein [Gemmatimonadaceae bacterium]